LLTSHVDLYGRIKGFLEPTTTAASKHPKVQEAKDKFRADGTGKIKSWQQVSQRFGLFERYMIANDFPYGEWLKGLGVLGIHFFPSRRRRGEPRPHGRDDLDLRERDFVDVTLLRCGLTR
jgi:hypothetical protein